jgi:hypothetical protein
VPVWFGGYTSATLANMTHPHPRLPVTGISYLVGVWRATTNPGGAPYPDHLLTVHPDGTFLIGNPTNVEQGADLSGINDSVGMGVWHTADIFPHNIGPGVLYVFEASFVQLNAHAASHLPVADLRVAFRVDLDSNEPNEFRGHVVTRFGNNPPTPSATLTGHRVLLDEELLAEVP